MSGAPSPRHPRAALSPRLPYGDGAEVVRSPHAASGRNATPFNTDGPPPHAYPEASARLRPKPAPPQHSSSASLAQYGASPHGLAPTLDPFGQLYHNPSLTVRTARMDSSKPLLTPLAVRMRGAPLARWRVAVAAAALVVVLTTIALARRLRMTPRATIEANMAACEPPYDTIDPHHARDVMHHDPSDIPLHSPVAIAIVSLHDTRKLTLPYELSRMTGLEPGTAADALDVTWRNRRDYAERHGYALIDGTQHRSAERRESWYKIKAVEAVLDDYDWVFYLDADAWITNPEIKLESVLPKQGLADFVVTADSTGLNAGSWMLRNSDWSREFLRKWWALTSFIQPPGNTFSGDNHAMRHLVATLPAEERALHVVSPPQCAMNSYLWRASPRQWLRALSHGRSMRSGLWRPGHLLVHLAGWHPSAGLKRLQELLRDPRNALGVEQPRTMPLPRKSRKLISDGDEMAAPVATLGGDDPEAAVEQQAVLAAELSAAGNPAVATGRKELQGKASATPLDTPGPVTAQAAPARQRVRDGKQAPRRLRDARARRTAGAGGGAVPAAEALAVPAGAADVVVEEEEQYEGGGAWGGAGALPVREDAGNLEEDEEAEHGTGPQWQLEIDDREVPASHFRPRAAQPAGASGGGRAERRAGVAAGVQDAAEHMRRQQDATVQQWLEGRGALDAQRNAAGLA